MNIEMLPGLGNVIRFPLEQRVSPSISLLNEIQPDVREVLLIEEAFQLDGMDDGLFVATDRETARYIAEQVLPAPPSELRRLLDGLLEPVVRRAVEACRSAHDATTRAVEAQKLAHAAALQGGHWMAPLEGRAMSLTEHAAVLLIEAHNRCQEAHGVDRAVSFARQGDSWRPYDHTEETEMLLLGIKPARQLETA